MHKIHESLEALAVPVSTLTPDPDNARVHTDRNLDAIAASLRAYGQRKPIVVQQAGMIVRAGNGTLDAVRRLGWDQVAAVVVDEEDISASAYGLADNRTAELASWDEATLAKVLSSVALAEGFDPMALGWEEREVVKLIADYGGFDDLDLEDILPDKDAPEKADEAPHTDPTSVVHPPSADTRMVQLFYTESQHSEFLAAVHKIAAKSGDSDVGSAVLRAVLAYAKESS